jgi:hypothetical protein
MKTFLGLLFASLVVWALWSCSGTRVPRPLGTPTATPNAVQAAETAIAEAQAEAKAVEEMATAQILYATATAIAAQAHVSATALAPTAAVTTVAARVIQIAPVTVTLTASPTVAPATPTPTATVTETVVITTPVVIEAAPEAAPAETKTEAPAAPADVLDVEAILGPATGEPGRDRDFTYQAFEKVRMMWIGLPHNQIVILDSAEALTGTFTVVPNTWDASQDAFACDEARAAGGPAMGFGKVWCGNQAAYGAPQGGEVGGKANVQQHEKGFVLYDGTSYYVFEGFTSGSWQSR